MKSIKSMSNIEFADFLDQLVLGDNNAFLMVKELAENGDHEAQFHLSTCYSGDKFGVKDDSLAMKWLLSAAENGCSDAQYMIGVYYADGTRGFKQCDAAAVQWWQKAASNGAFTAAAALASFSAMGRT